MAERAVLPNAPEAQKNTRKSYTTNEKLHATLRWLPHGILHKAHLKCTNMIKHLVKCISLLSAGFRHVEIRAYALNNKRVRYMYIRMYGSN